jgi:hypothetical protein
LAALEAPLAAPLAADLAPLAPAAAPRLAAAEAERFNASLIDVGLAHTKTSTSYANDASVFMACTSGSATLSTTNTIKM